MKKSALDQAKSMALNLGGKIAQGAGNLGNKALKETGRLASKWATNVTSDFKGELGRLNPLTQVKNKLSTPLVITQTFATPTPQKPSPTVTRTPTSTPTPTYQPPAQVKPAQQVLAPSPQPTPILPGYTNKMPPQEVASILVKAATDNGIEPAILASILFSESGFNPKAVNRGKYETGQAYTDRGIAQINNVAHPDVSDEQAYDPNFAVPWAARNVANAYKQFNDYNRAIAAYNVGRGGANIKGPQPYGGGPRGQQYVDKVTRNLTPDMIRKYKLRPSYTY